MATFFFLLPVDDAASTASDARELTTLLVALGSMGVVVASIGLRRRVMVAHNFGRHGVVVAHGVCGTFGRHRGVVVGRAPVDLAEHEVMHEILEGFGIVIVEVEVSYDRPCVPLESEVLPLPHQPALHSHSRGGIQL